MEAEWVNWFHSVRTRRLSDFYSRFEITLYTFLACLLTYIGPTHVVHRFLGYLEGEKKNRKNRKRLEGIGRDWKSTEM